VVYRTLSGMVHGPLLARMSAYLERVTTEVVKLLAVLALFDENSPTRFTLLSTLADGRRQYERTNDCGVFTVPGPPGLSGLARTMSVKKAIFEWQSTLVTAGGASPDIRSQ
jgi:hypothetical protein